MEQGFAMTARDVKGLRAETDQGFAMVRSEMATQKAEILTVISDRLRGQTWVLFSALVAGIGAAAAISRI